MLLTRDFQQTGSEQKALNIAAIIPRGEVVRNFVYSGALDHVAKHADLSLLTVPMNSDLDTLLKERFGSIYALDETDERWAVRFQREILDVAHGRWLWSAAAKERWRLRDWESKSLWQKASRTAKKAIGQPFANRSGLKILTKIERASSRILNSDDRYLALYRKIQPGLVFNGSHVHSRNAIQAVQAAQWLGIPTATFIFSWDNLTSQGRIHLPYDYYLVWNDDVKRQLIEMYGTIRPDQVFVTGTPQFDFHFQSKYYKTREMFCSESGLDASRPFVLYSTGMANHMPGEPELVEEIADLLLEINPENPPQLLVRVYAKDRTGRFEELKRRRTDIVFPTVAWEQAWLTPKYEDSYALVNALRHCSFGINVASTISLELCMFDKPVINIGYNPKSVDESDLSYANYYDFDHYRPVVESGAVDVARNQLQMRELICRALSEPERRTNERKALIRKMFGDTLDGRSGCRVAKVLLDISREGKQTKWPLRT